MTPHGGTRTDVQLSVAASTRHRCSMSLITTGHDDRPVHVLDGPQGAVVAKRYRDVDARPIWALHVDLWASSFGQTRSPAGVPAPLSFDAATATITMELLVGEPLGTRGDLGRSLERVRPAARLLADLHRSRVEPARHRSARSVARSIQRKAFDIADPTLGDLMFDIARSLAARADLDEHLVASHGDFSPRNVFVTPTGLRLIDFDRMQLAGRGRDIAYWGAWIWVTQLLRGETPSWDAADDFVTEYAVVAPGVLRELERTLGFHRSAALCRIAHGWSALQQRPDLARIVLEEAAKTP